MSPDSGGLLFRAKAHPDRQVKGHDHANCHGFPVKEPVGKSAFRLKRMAKCMTQIEQGARTCFLFIPGNHVRLGLTTGNDGLYPRRRITGDDFPGLPVKPVKKLAVIDQAVFNHLRITGQQLSLWQAVQATDIAQNQTGLVKTANKVFAARTVDGAFAADGAVNLCQQGGGNLDKADTTLINTCGKSGKITDNSATKGDDPVLTFQPESQKLVEKIFQLGKGFCRFPCGQDDAVKCYAGLFQRLFQPGKLISGNIVIGDDHRSGAG